MSDTATNYDPPWKEIMGNYFPTLMRTFYPLAYEQIDWSKGYKFLDKELEQVVRDAQTGKRYVDKLVEVTLKDPTTTIWVLIHLEVQGSKESNFEERLYIYNYRIYDKYRKKVATLVILTDDSPNWRPTHFGYELFGFKIQMEFPIVKLLDYADQTDQMLRESNPFAIVILAHLQTRATRQNNQERYAAKLHLAKLLYQHGYSRQDILELFRFLDWIMTLPEELELQFRQDVIQYEMEVKMKYLTSIERLAREEGLQLGVQQGLQLGVQQGLQRGQQEAIRQSILMVLSVRFGQLPTLLVEKIGEIEDWVVLQTILQKAVVTASVPAFLQELNTLSFPLPTPIQPA